MKELSIEEKAKRYDESRERMKDFLKEWENCGALGEAMEKAKAVFPELTESEDERIRKAMIDFFKHEREEGITVLHYGVNIECMISWLEKQGEQKPADKVEPDILIEESYQQQADDLIDMVTEKTAWSEEDTKMVESIITDIKYCKKAYNNYSFHENEIGWLKSLKDRVQPQPKQEWSEEDETMWAEISDLLWEGYKQSGSKFSWDDIRNWVNPKLKSIRPQSQWKPSERQKEALLWCVVHLGGADKQALGELLEELNKL